MQSFLVYIFPYLIGSIPFGLLLTKAAGLGDIRAIGSGNIGATNVLRTGHKPLALLTLLLDVFKGALAVHIAKTLGATSDAVYLAGLAAVIGHMFPIWLKFKGGKGVATIFGVLIVFSPLLAACSAAVWLGVFLITRYSSLSALISIPLAPAFALLLGATQTPEQSAILVLLATLMIMRHKQNILNLMEGKESKFGKPHA
jgi:glycerol-3-phosphate acyltransferase PlsY